MNRDTKLIEKSTCRFKIGIRNLTNFDVRTTSLKNFHFHGLLLTKVFIAWAKKVQRNYLSWHWRVMQNLKKNWLVAWKMTWGIWQIFTRTLGSVKIGTLMVSFRPKMYENVWAENLKRSYVSWQWRKIQKLKRNWLVILKLI